MDWTTLLAIATTAAAGLGGWFSKQGIDAWKKYREEKRIDVKFEDDRHDHEDAKEEKTLLQIINRQDGELLSLRGEIKEMRADHRSELTKVHEQRNECQKQLSSLQTELRIRMEDMAARVCKVEETQVKTDKTVEQHHKEQGNGDSKVVLEMHTPKIVLQDGADLDPNDPEDAALIKAIADRRESKRLHDEKHKADAASRLPAS